VAGQRGGRRQAPRERVRSIDPAAKTQVQRRPTVGQWLWYAFGGGLPPQLSQWVLKDNTRPTWWLRHFARATVQMAIPVAAIALFLPDGWDVKGYVLAFAVATGYMCSGFVMWGVTEHRMTKAGFAPGVAEQVRAERGEIRRGER
jgi:hypothetical protein